MFGNIKRWLGIEGVKLELNVPHTISKKESMISGQIFLASMHDQEVKEVKVKMIEIYSRGRRKAKRIDEYEIGEIVLEQVIKIPKEELVAIDFNLPFVLSKSEMDEVADKNPLFGKTAKWIYGANSKFRIEAEAIVKGTALNPFDSVEVKVK